MVNKHLDYCMNLVTNHVAMNVHIMTGQTKTNQYVCSLSMFKIIARLNGTRVVADNFGGY